MGREGENKKEEKQPAACSRRHVNPEGNRTKAFLISIGVEVGGEEGACYRLCVR